MIILVMVDGVRPDALDATPCPTFAALRARGASTLHAQSVMPSVTLPCHMSIFHSVPPARHGITDNLYLPMARPVTGLVERLRHHGHRSAFIHNWEPLRDLNRPETLALSYYVEPPYTHQYDNDVATQAARVIADGRHTFVFAYLGGVDVAGHAFGWMSSGYLEQLRHLDADLGTIIAAVPADATVIVQADHGGHERTHGTASPEDMTIPWMACGPRIRAGYTIAGPVSLLDTAPTIAHLLGIGPDAAWEGRAITEMLI
ncbi:MAG: alkaline phosphatase family protein [Chloroflexi bacterium]|nr:alkaline phosphatase family protein [Chloroflexota bacterium]